MIALGFAWLSVGILGTFGVWLIARPYALFGDSDRIARYWGRRLSQDFSARVRQALERRRADGNIERAPVLILGFATCLAALIAGLRIGLFPYVYATWVVIAGPLLAYAYLRSRGPKIRTAFLEPRRIASGVDWYFVAFGIISCVAVVPVFLYAPSATPLLRGLVVGAALVPVLCAWCLIYAPAHLSSIDPWLENLVDNAIRNQRSVELLTLAAVSTNMLSFVTTHAEGANPPIAADVVLFACSFASAALLLRFIRAVFRVDDQAYTENTIAQA
jgi:hypothetical protein